MSESRCGRCGADPGEPCRDSSDNVVPDHFERTRADAYKVRARARAQETQNILLGHPSAYERFMRNDSRNLDAWRVRIVCACLRSAELEGEGVAAIVLAAFPWPVRILLAWDDALALLLAPIGDVEERAREIRRASLAAVEGRMSVDGEPTTARDAVTLCVLKDTTPTPTDWMLRAVRARLVSSTKDISRALT